MGKVLEQSKFDHHVFIYIEAWTEPPVILEARLTWHSKPFIWKSRLMCAGEVSVIWNSINPVKLGQIQSTQYKILLTTVSSTASISICFAVFSRSPVPSVNAFIASFEKQLKLIFHPFGHYNLYLHTKALRFDTARYCRSYKGLSGWLCSRSSLW